MKIVNDAKGAVDDQPCLAGLSLTAGTSGFDVCLGEKDLRSIRLEARATVYRRDRMTVMM
jgi:hypothetical protein